MIMTFRFDLSMSWIAANFKKDKKMVDPFKMSASELGDAFENNLINPVEVLEAYFEAIQKSTLTERIYVELSLIHI